jgi:hypothetical protein
VWTYELGDNLYCPMSEETRATFEGADGGELYAGRPGKGNMYALHSSSAAAYNVFAPWESANELAPLLRALKLPSRLPGHLAFETQFPIDETLFERAPNIDVTISFDQGPLKTAAIECKLCEPYASRAHPGLSKQYLQLPLWEQFPALRQIAGSIAPDDKLFRHLHAAQLLKHILGLATRHGTRFKLFYCWYDAPGAAAVHHAAEINSFADAAAADGVAFNSLTYQELILRLSRDEQVPRPYVDYLAERYL